VHPPVGDPIAQPPPTCEIEGAFARRAAILTAATEQGTCDFLPEVASSCPPGHRPCSACPNRTATDSSGPTRTLDYDDRELGETSARSAQAGAEMFARLRAAEAKRRCPADDLLSVVANAELPTTPVPVARSPTSSSRCSST
jgi:hypothetical protein